MNKTEKALRTGALHVCGILAVPLRLMGAAAGMYRTKKDAERMIKAIEWANLLAQKTGYRYMVLNINGRYTVKPKRVWQGLLNCRGKYFKKGTTIQELEKKAVFITK